MPRRLTLSVTWHVTLADTAAALQSALRSLYYTDGRMRSTLRGDACRIGVEYRK